MNDNYILDILGSLEKNASKKQINSDICQLEKVINMLRITGTFAKVNTKKELNSYIKSLQSQLNYVKLTAKIDGKNVKREIDNALHGMKFKDIDALNIDESKTKLKARKIIADVKALAEGSPVTVNLEYRKNKLNNDLTTYLNKNTKITESSILLKESEKIRELIDSISDKKSLTEATDAFRLFKSEVSATGFTSKSTADKIKSMLGHITKIGSAFGVASMAVNNFVKSLQTLRSNDTIITEISKTSEMTKNQLKELEDEAFKIASKYGQLSSNFLLATQEMARAGYDDNIKEMAELSTKAQGAGNMAAELANKYIIATDKAFKMNGSIETLTTTLDGANNITNNNALTMSDLGEAMSVVGSQAASSGMAVNETTAAVSTMIATTQRSGREMANAFKGILMNFRQVSGDVGDGEDIIDAESLTKYEKACAELGVSLSTAKDGIVSLKEPMQVIKELSEAYTQLEESDARRANLLSAVGGKYRANALNAILENYDMYEKMLKEYADGFGSMDEEAEKTANSWEGRLAALQNSWDSFINTLTNKEAIMNGISLFDRMIQGAESFVDTFGAIPTVLTAINTSMVAMHKDYGITKVWDKEAGKIDLEGNIFGIDFSAIKNQKKHFEEAAVAIKRWNKELVNGKADLNVFDNACVKNSAQLKEYLATCSKDAPASLSGYRQYLESTGQATEGLRLKTLLLNTALTMLGGIAVQLIVTGIQKAWDTLNVTVEEQTEKINNLKSSYEGLKSEYDDLSQKQDITDAEKRRLEYLERRLELDKRILKAEQAQLFDEKTGNKFTDLFDKDNLNTQYYSEMNPRNKEGFKVHSLFYDSKMDGIDDIHKQITEWKELQATVEEGSLAWNSYQDAIDRAQEKETKYIDKLSESENQLTINLGKYADNIEFLQGQLDTGELTEDQTNIANEELKRWQTLYNQTERMIVQIQKLNGTYDDTDERMAKSLRSIYDNHGLTDRDAYSNDEYGYEKLQEYTSKLTPEQKELWMVTTAGIHNAKQAIDAFEAKLEETGQQLQEDSILTSTTITQAVNQINTQLKPAFDSLKSAYQDIFSLDEDTGEQLFSLKDISIETFESIRAELEKLDGIDGINVDYSAFENFVSVLSDTSSTADEVQQQFDNLATSIIYTTDCTNMSAETYDLLVQSLSEMGVTNAEEVLTNLKNIQEELVQAGYNLADITLEEAVRLIELGQISLETAEYLKLYMIQKELAQNPLNTVSDILALEQLCNSLGVTAEMLGYVDALKRAFNAQELGATGIEPTIANLKSKIAGLANGQGEFKFNFSAPKTAKSGSKSKTKKDTTKEYDWIEQAIENVEKEIKELDEVADSSYSTFSQKNEALTKEIGKVTDEIELQQKAYEEYMRKADSIGLPDSYKELVQNGAINIEDIKDEKLQEQIEGYQKWYDKAQKASDAIGDLKTDIKDLHTELKNLHIEAYKQQTEKLKDRLDSDSITEKQYLAGLKSAYEQFYGGLEEYAEQYHEAVLEYLEEEKKYLNSVASAAASLVDTEIKRIQDVTDEQEDQIKGQIELLEARKKPLQDELDALDEKVRKEEQALNLQKAQYDLAKAENQRSKLIYTADKGIIFTNDSKAVRSAKKDVDDAKLEIHKQSIQDQIDALDDEIGRYNDLIDQINKAADAQVKALEKIKNKWQEVIDQQEQAKNVTILTGEFGADAITKILTGNDDDLLAQWKNSYINTLKNIDKESQGYIGDMTKQIESLYRDSANAISNIKIAQPRVNTIDEPIVDENGSLLMPLQPGDRAYDLLLKVQPLVDKIISGEMDVISNAVFEGQRQMEQWVKTVNYSNVFNKIANNQNMQPSIKVDNINITCPGVTSHEVMQEVGMALEKQLGHISLKAIQAPLRDY